MKIPIDRAKRIELLKWLKQGFMDSETLSEWIDIKGRSIEEIESELRRLNKCSYPMDCHRLKEIGCCVDYNRKHRIWQNGVVLPQDSEEIPAEYLEDLTSGGE